MLVTKIDWYGLTPSLDRGNAGGDISESHAEDDTPPHTSVKKHPPLLAKRINPLFKLFVYYVSLYNSNATVSQKNTWVCFQKVQSLIVQTQSLSTTPHLLQKCTKNTGEHLNEFCLTKMKLHGEHLSYKGELNDYLNIASIQHLTKTLIGVAPSILWLSQYFPAVMQ